MAAWARDKVPDVDVERMTDAFIDYWQDKPGKDATKLSWVGTWRNWMRREQEKAERARSRSPAFAPNATDQRVTALLQPLANLPNLRALPGGA
jgi:hypothetical protein